MIRHKAATVPFVCDYCGREEKVQLQVDHDHVSVRLFGNPAVGDLLGLPLYWSAVQTTRRIVGNMGESSHRARLVRFHACPDCSERHLSPRTSQIDHVAGQTHPEAPDDS